MSRHDTRPGDQQGLLPMLAAEAAINHDPSADAMAAAIGRVVRENVPAADGLCQRELMQLIGATVAASRQLFLASRQLSGRQLSAALPLIEHLSEVAEGSIRLANRSDADSSRG